MQTDQEKIEIMTRALEDIADPIGAMRRELPPGYKLNGIGAIRAAEDAEFYKRRAREALTKVGFQSSEGEPHG